MRRRGSNDNTRSAEGGVGLLQQNHGTDSLDWRSASSGGGGERCEIFGSVKKRGNNWRKHCQFERHAVEERVAEKFGGKAAEVERGQFGEGSDKLEGSHRCRM